MAKKPKNKGGRPIQSADGRTEFVGATVPEGIVRRVKTQQKRRKLPSLSAAVTEALRQWVGCPADGDR